MITSIHLLTKMKVYFPVPFETCPLPPADVHTTTVPNFTLGLYIFMYTRMPINVQRGH